MKKKTEILLFVLLMLVLVPLEVLCAYLSYETIGEITSGAYFVAVGVNVLFVVVAFRSRAIAAIGAIVLGLLIIPYQIVLGHRLLEVEKEAAGIVSWAYEQKVHTNAFPADLSGYTWRNPAMKKYIQSYDIYEAGGFGVTYRVGTEDTSHGYGTKDGWGYYPD
jgi:hypothetical protein